GHKILHQHVVGVVGPSLKIIPCDPDNVWDILVTISQECPEVIHLSVATCTGKRHERACLPYIEKYGHAIVGRCAYVTIDTRPKSGVGGRNVVIALVRSRCKRLYAIVGTEIIPTIWYVI